MKQFVAAVLTLAFVFGCLVNVQASISFSFKRSNTRITPNSVIDISRVGREYQSYWYYYNQYTNEGPLVCHTDNQYCCRDVDDPFENEESGEWYYPDGQVVDSGERYREFYVTRGYRQLSLHSYNAYRPTGVYCCDMLSVNGSGNITADFVSPTNLTYVNSSTSKCIGLYTSSQLRLCPDISLSNGYVRYDSAYIPGRVATITCNNGFSIVGSRYSTCSYWGWSVRYPRCVYDCGFLPPPKNGKVSFSSGTTAGSVATYSCDDGFHLVGGSTRYCQYSSSSYYYYRSRNGWTNSEPYCVDEAKVQLLFSPSYNCLDWSASKASVLGSYLVDAIQRVVSESGDYPTVGSNYSLPRSNIQPGFFSCRAQQGATTFRTTITGLRGISAHSFVETIQQWVYNGPAVRVEWYLLDINKECPVAITSDYQEECFLDQSLERCPDKCYRSYDKPNVVANKS